MIDEEDFGGDSTDDNDSVKVIAVRGGKRRRIRREVVEEVPELNKGKDQDGDLELHLGSLFRLATLLCS